MGTSNEINIVYLIFSGALIIFLLVASIAVFLFLHQRRLYGQQQIFYEAETKYKETLLYANLSIIDEERKRFSRELHDEIGSIFSTLSLTLSSAKDKIKQEELLLVFADSQKLISRGIENMHRILYDIVPPEIEIFGFSGAIEELCDRIGKGKDISVSFCERINHKRRLEDQVEMALYRIIQELINNTVKHACASQVTLDINWQSDGLLIQYTDNGNGFDLSHKSTDCIGLRNIGSRANMIKAPIQFTSLPGAGMSFSLNLKYL